MKASRGLRLAAVLVVVTSTGVAAQTAPPGNIWSHGTTVNVFGGLASASSKSGALAGGAAGWEITPRFGLEGSVTWFERPGTAEAFAAALTAHAALTGKRTAAPFIKGGVGLYRASFGAARAEVPDFYRRRFDAGGPAFGTSHIFTDPSFVVGGGVNLFTTRHLVIRPEIEAIVVRRQSRSYVVTAATMHVAYHFEEHPITSVREGK